MASGTKNGGGGRETDRGAGRTRSRAPRGRSRIPDGQRRRLIAANAGMCCVCKRRGVGVEIHHLDQDPKNNADENLVVLCPLDHDHVHRPRSYTARSHGDLDEEVLRRHKRDWEWFVAAARRPAPPVGACLTFHTVDGVAIGSAKLVFQGSDGKVYLKRRYEEHDHGPMEAWADAIREELASFGPEVGLLTITEPFPVEHCPCCKEKAGVYRSYDRTVDSPLFERLTRPDWREKSVMSIYVNPERPSLAVSVGYADCRGAYTVSLHRCGGRLHFMDGKQQWAVPIKPGRSVRTLVTREVERLDRRWKTGLVLVSTGDPDDPRIIEGLDLPRLGCCRSGGR